MACTLAQFQAKHSFLHIVDHHANIFCVKKMPFSWFCRLRRLVFGQSSPVGPVSESRGGTLSATSYLSTLWFVDCNNRIYSKLFRANKPNLTCLTVWKKSQEGNWTCQETPCFTKPTQLTTRAEAIIGLLVWKRNRWTPTYLGVPTAKVIK